MSVIFGQLGADLDCFNSLLAHFHTVWSERTIQAQSLAELGAGAAAGQPAGYFPAVQVVYEPGLNRLYTLSGYLWTGQGFPLDEASARQTIIEAGDRLIELGELDLPADWGGVFTLAAFDLAQRRVWVTGDPSGLLPIYYTQQGSGLVFSSYSRPLASAIRSGLDATSVVQNTALRYMIGSRTLYRDIYRLRPGQSLCFSEAEQRLLIRQPHGFYSAITPYRTLDETTDALWADYLDGMRQIARPAGKNGLLLSGGMDSRMVAIGLRHYEKELTTITMGDPDNYEVNLAQRVARLADTQTTLYTPVVEMSAEIAQRLTDRAEWASFPYFEHCAKILRQQGAISASTGFGGELFVGGNAFLIMGDKWNRNYRFKMALRRSIGLSHGFNWPVNATTISTAIDDLRTNATKALMRYRKYLQPDWQPFFEQTVESIGDEIDAEIKRILANNPATIQQLVERYWMEHYTSEYCRQEFTLFTELPIALPILHHTFFRRCSNLDPAHKVDHGIYLRLVRRHYGQFASIPSANIPIPLTYPDLILWFARANRANIDKKVVQQQISSRGTNQRRRYGWPNFENWMRQTDFLARVPEMALGSIYDQDVVREKTERIAAWQERVFNGQELLGLVSTSQMAQGFQVS